MRRDPWKARWQGDRCKAQACKAQGSEAQEVDRCGHKAPQTSPGNLLGLCRLWAANFGMWITPENYIVAVCSYILA